MDKTQPKKLVQSLSGVIVSMKNIKTIIVSVTNVTRHPLYKKEVKTTKRYAVHNEVEGLAIGDHVLISSTKPISKTKFFKVMEKIIQ